MNTSTAKIGMLLGLVLPGLLFALATEQIGPTEKVDSWYWTEGIKTMGRHPGRVYSRWVNGDERLYFQVNEIQQIRELVAVFSTLAKEPVLLIESGSGSEVKTLLDGKTFDYNLCLRAPEGIYLSMAKEKNDPIQWPTEPQLLLIAQEDQLKQIEIPKNILVVRKNPESSESAGSAAVQQDRVAAGNTEFAWDLYRQLAGLPEPKTATGNLFFSPYSISTALAMTYGGARGQTEAQMRDTLRFFDPQADFHAAFGRLEQILNQQGQKGDYQLAVANALWMQKDFSFLESFLIPAQEQYSAKLETVDFKTDAEGVRQMINAWVESKTNDRIKDLIPPGMLDAATRLVLTNAIYFKGDWAEQFDKERTKEDLFTVSAYTVEDGKPKVEYTRVQVPMMNRKDDFPYAENEICQVLELPYRGGDLSMQILLPKEQDLFALEQALTPETLKLWTNGLRKQEVEVFVPRFTMTCEYQLSRTLAAMGMPEAFSGLADFSGMTGSRDLFISDVIHKAFVEVNEEGTEAAAATGVVMKLTSMPAPPPVFRADKPFVFMIKDNGTGSILFIGRVTDPSKEK